MSRPSSGSLELTTPEVAERLNKSLAWVKKHATTLGGRIVEGRYLFPQIEIERRRTSTTERITIGSGRAPEPDVGARAAAVYSMLEENASHSQIVRDLKESPAFVTSMRQQWIAGYEADRQGLAFTCNCGAAADPATARCAKCFSRTRTLSDAQQAVLAGADLPEPNTCTCKGCSATVRTEDADSLCARCAEKLTVAERGGVLVVVLGGTVLRQLTIAETRTIVQRLAHHLPKEAFA